VSREILIYNIKMKSNYYFYDLHVHTKKSPDSISTVKELIKIAKKRGLTGFAITDHEKTYNGEEEIDGITIIPGSEITLKDDSHLLAYYIKKPLPKKKLTLVEAVRLIKEQGGYCSLAHPTNILGGYFKNGGFFKIRNRSKKEIKDALEIVDAVEIGNASETNQLRASAKKIVENLFIKKRYTAGSDSHSPNSLGLGIIKTKEPLTKENFLKVIEEGEIIIKTEFNFIRKILHLVERFFIKIAIITFLYNNKISRKIFYKIFYHTYLKTKYFLLKYKKTFNFKEEYNGD
jgi:predicted metal-dependent phosphoesterase TrpH